MTEYNEMRKRFRRAQRAASLRLKEEKVLAGNVHYQSYPTRDDNPVDYRIFTDMSLAADNEMAYVDELFSGEETE